jgi:hypothetical protein
VTNWSLLAISLILQVALPGHAQRATAPEASGSVVGEAEAGGRVEASIPAVQRAPEAFAGRRMRVEGLVVRTTQRAHGSVALLSFLLRDDRGDTISVYEPEALPEIGGRVRVDGEVGAGPNGVVSLGAGTAGLSVVRMTAPAALPGGDPSSAQPAPLQAAACEAGGGGGLIHRLACAGAGALFWVGLAAGAGLLAGIALLAVVLRRRRGDDDMIPLVFGDDSSRERTFVRTVPGAMATADERTSEGAGDPLFSDVDIERFNATVRGGHFTDPPPMPSTTSRPTTIPVPGLVAEPRRAAAPPVAPEPLTVAEAGAEAGPVVSVQAWSTAEPPESAEPQKAAQSRTSTEAAMPAAAPPFAEASSDELVQLLPGRLEALEGPPGNPEIRFFRISSMEVPEITFGRSEGPTYRHVQLFAPTVSRTHARIRFVERRWTITNLSAVNPVVVNDVELRGEGEEQTLSDGDVVQIGEYVFRYRDKG